MKKTASNKQYVGLVSSVDMGRPSAKMFYLFCVTALTILALFCVLPPLWVLLSGFKDGKEFISVPPTLFPKTFKIEKFIDTWFLLKFERYYINTLIMAGGCIIFKIVFAGLAGYVLAVLKPKGIGVIEKLLFFTMMIPANVKMATLYTNIVKLDMLNSYVPLWLLAAIDTFMVLIFKSFFEGIPISLIESARLDGCGELTTLFRIILPLSKPVVMTSVILTLNTAWSDFFWPYLILKNKDMYTVMLQIFSVRSSTSVDVVMLSLIFVIIPPIILFAFFQRFIMSGFTMSGIKG